MSDATEANGGDDWADLPTIGPSRRQVVLRILLLAAILVLVFVVLLPRVVDIQAVAMPRSPG